MSEHIDAGQLGVAEREALRRLVVGLADSKRLLGIRYSDWLLGSPSIESGIALSSMTQDEWGHARLLYAMLKALGDDPVTVEHDRPAEAYANLDALDAPFADWAAVVAGMVVVDGALGAVLASFAEGRFEAARNRVPKMLAEEGFHRDLGAAWFTRLARAGGEAGDRLRTAVETMLPSTLAWVGADDEAARLLVAAGVWEEAGARLDRYRQAVGDILSAAGVDISGASPAPGWDEARGRGPGRPDDEAVERARGDRNRALFVE